MDPNRGDIREAIRNAGAGMKFFQLVRCAFGQHRRDRRLARYDGEDFRSVCTGCGQAMIRRHDGWHVAEPTDPAVEP